MKTEKRKEKKGQERITLLYCVETLGVLEEQQPSR